MKECLSICRPVLALTVVEKEQGELVDGNIFDLNGFLREAEVLADELRGKYKYSSEDDTWYRFIWDTLSALLQR